MSSVDRRSVTTIRHEYIVSAPAVWADVGEAMAFAKRDMEAAGKETHWDDAALVTHDDENIIVYWEEVQP